MYYYRNGGYPSEDSKPKLWSIINSFVYAVKTMKDLEIDYVNKELKRFGLDVTFNEMDSDNLYNFEDDYYEISNSDDEESEGDEIDDDMLNMIN